MKQDWFGKKVKLIFQDYSKTLIKYGIVKSADLNFVTLEHDTGLLEIIPTSRVLRIEVLK